MPPKSNPNQESLFVFGEHTELVYPRESVANISGEITPVDPVEERLHLINCLSFLAGAKMRDGLVKLGPEGVTDRYGDQASAVVLAAYQRGQEMRIMAQHAFARATGLQERIAAGEDPARAKAAVREQFSDFLKKYYLGENHYENSRVYRRQLVAEVKAMLENPEHKVSLFNHAHGLQPHHDAGVADVEAIPGISKELPDLSTRQRLEAILFDPRAGFMAKTHNEKNRVLSWLDYLDNPELYPLGIANQLREVMIHSQSPDKARSIRRGAQWGLRAQESIAWEMADCLLDAARQLQNIRRLQTDVADSDAYGATMVDEFGIKHPGYGAWVRHQALSELMGAGVVSGLMADPLKTSERRLKPKQMGDNAPGKHKIILNQFTRPDRHPMFRVYLESVVSSTTVGSVRKQADLFDDIVADLQNEYDFMHRQIVGLTEANVTRNEASRYEMVAETTFAELGKLGLAA